jgi:hypothetical protein
MTTKPLATLLAVALLGCSPVHAARPAPLPEAPFARIIELLGLDTTRAEIVAAIFENAHARTEQAREQLGEPTHEAVRVALDAALQAIHQDVERQLCAVLGPEDLARVKAEIPSPRAARVLKSV